MSKELKRWAKLADLPKKPKKQQLDENIGGIVGIPAISQITHTPTIYETAFEHFLSEKYENVEEEFEPAEWEKQHDLEVDPYDYERKIVHKVIDGVANDFSGEDMMTREYINGIIAALEELKINDF